MAKAAQTYTVLIADDEKLARDSVKVLLHGNPDWRIVGEAVDGNEAIQLMNRLKPDLVFLDIDMPYVKGIDVLKRSKHKPYTVFTTAYDSFAVRAFEENAIDYLLKPFTDHRFYAALEKVKVRIVEHASTDKLTTILEVLHRDDNAVDREDQMITVRTSDRIVLLDASEILWINASGNYVELFTTETKYLHYESMSNMEQLLSDAEFIRIHRSHIVRQNQIKSLRKHMNGEYFVLLKSGVELKLSRTNRGKVKRILGDLK